MERKEILQYFHLTEEWAWAATGEINKKEQYTAKKLGQNIKNKEYKKTKYGKPSSKAMLCMQGGRSWNQGLQKEEKYIT